MLVYEGQTFEIGETVTVYPPETKPPEENYKEHCTWVSGLVPFHGKSGKITTINAYWEAVHVEIDDSEWAYHCSWVKKGEGKELAPCLRGRDVPGYTDTYVSGDDFMSIIRQMSEGRGM